MMIRTREGKVAEICADRDDLQEIRVEIGGSRMPALVYTGITGRVAKGDRVLVNTTARFLGLGTGGYDFVIANLDNTETDITGSGHIMKLRYTPLQLKCLTAEEQQSELHSVIESFESLRGRPIVTISLHSMLGPICALAKRLKPCIKTGYVMTDGAALPAALSKTITELKNMGLLDVVVTCGNAFGGDLETVNFYTGIIAAVEAAKCELVIVGMGPGITGTGTRYGFTGVEQGYIIDGITTLGGLPVAVPRISFSDDRQRHRGISHHSLTVLGKIAKTASLLPLPELEGSKIEYITNQLREHGIEKKHIIVFNRGEEVLKAMEDYGLKTTTMGRNAEEDRDFFLGAGASVMALRGLLL